MNSSLLLQTKTGLDTLREMEKMLTSLLLVLLIVHRLTSSRTINLREGDILLGFDGQSMDSDQIHSFAITDRDRLEKIKSFNKILQNVYSHKYATRMFETSKKCNFN